MSIRIIYLLFFYIGVNYSLAGIATPFVAEKFAVESYMVGYAYTFFSVGQTLAVIGNSRFLRRVAPRREIWFAISLLVVAIAGITTSVNLIVFSLSTFLCGAGVGIFASVGNYAVMTSWNGGERAVRLNLLNFFFSFGAIVAPVLAGLLLARGIGWEILYLLGGVLLVFAAVFASRIPVAVTLEFSRKPETSKYWPLSVYVSGVALFMYVLSEVIVSFWLVSYLRQTLSMELSTAGLFLSVFWGAIAIGRFCSGLLANRFAPYRMILAGATLALGSYICLLAAHSPEVVVSLITLMGLGYSGLYASILTYGTQQAAPSPGLTTFFVSIGCAGGVLSYALSSLLNQLFGLWTAMACGAVLMGIVIFLTLVVDRVGVVKVGKVCD